MDFCFSAYNDAIGNQILIVSNRRYYNGDGYRRGGCAAGGRSYSVVAYSDERRRRICTMSYVGRAAGGGLGRAASAPSPWQRSPPPNQLQKYVRDGTPSHLSRTLTGFIVNELAEMDAILISLFSYYDALADKTFEAVRMAQWESARHG